MAIRLRLVTTQLALATALLLLASPADAQLRRGPRTFAQTLLREVLRQHPQIKTMELAARRGGGCVTVAATDVGDIGDRCDAKETRVMRSREPDIEDPSMVDPAFVIAEALHDASGRLVGLVITDVVLGRGGTREAALARARAVRRDLESRIESLAQLTAGTPAASR
jgi:hypothetical protein